jgi:hypothetical protein
MYHNPNLPPALYQLVTPKPSPKSILIDTGKSTTSDDAATAATGLSTLTSSRTTLGSQQPSGAASSRSGTFIKNPNVDTALQSLLPTGIKITDLVGSDAVTTGDDNHPRCLSYHIRGGCFSNCRRRENHEKQLSAAEKQKLSNWVVNQTTKFPARVAGN